MSLSSDCLFFFRDLEMYIETQHLSGGVIFKTLLAHVTPNMKSGSVVWWTKKTPKSRPCFLAFDKVTSFLGKMVIHCC